jgi:hypothetical protein
MVVLQVNHLAANYTDDEIFSSYKSEPQSTLCNLGHRRAPLLVACQEEKKAKSDLHMTPRREWAAKLKQKPMGDFTFPLRR